MRVLIVGSGGREHALAWKVTQSPRLERLFVAPGNAGSAQIAENVPLPAEGPGAAATLVDFARQKRIDLVIVGPEGPLAEGLADDFTTAGVPVFGPSRLAAQIEASKAFAKDFMQRHGIATARYRRFDEIDQAVAHLASVDYPVVIKASGLAAGKGVILPEDQSAAYEALHSLMVDRQFGEAGSEVVIEERLEGPEVSLLAFSDGKCVRAMPPAQDHKRLLDGDRGPNTGGMGAYAPAPVCPPELAEQITTQVLQPAVDGLRSEGIPFVGVLYAGMILTPSGPQVLEFNCRFGDPETQAILPLLDTDLLDIAEACVQGRLEAIDIRWKRGAAACVVLASDGYPVRSAPARAIRLPDRLPESCAIFHAGTRVLGSEVMTAGGRVLGVTGWGEDIRQALDKAYGCVDQVHFEGMQYRKDIGHRALEGDSQYAAAGVDISAGNRAVELMSAAVRATYGPQVLAGIGAFGGLYHASGLRELKDPVLVASTDGVGTKVMLAAQAGSYASIGADLVNHCINDILVQGAAPLFFLDYFAAAKIDPRVVAEVVSGAAVACREAGCALLGGETAEMPGVYAGGQFDFAGTIVGVVEREHILPRPDLAPGDLLVGLRSSGPHTNGYSLIRKIFAGVPLDTVFPELGSPLGEALLRSHRSYLRELLPLVQDPAAGIKALVHITGGGFVENIPRVLPDGLGAVLYLGSWPVPPLFRLIQERGQVAEAEMRRVFNLGIGMIAIVAPQQAAALQASLGEETWVIGELSSGERKVSWQ